MRKGCDCDTGKLVRENAYLRALVREVLAGDWTDGEWALSLNSRLAESGWFKRARAKIG